MEGDIKGVMQGDMEGDMVNYPMLILSLSNFFFCTEQVEGVILSHCYSLDFLVRGLLHA